MLNQNYVQVYENEGGSVTIVASFPSDNTQQIELQSISIQHQDLKAISMALAAIAKENGVW